MGQKDYAQNDYFNDKVRFADACNGILFQGKEFIKPEELQEMNPDIVYWDKDKQKLRKTIPDKMCMWKGIYISVLAVENQSLVDYSMVFRAMKTEALSYEKQFKSLEREYRRQGLIGEKENLAWNVLAKDTRFVPVILIVIYYGQDKIWDGAKCLYDMLDMDKELEPYITNYKMNLFDYHDYEDFSFFTTENRELFEVLSCSKNEKKMDELFRTSLDRYKNLASDAVEVIFTLTGIDLSILEAIEDKEGLEVVDMCKAWDDHKEAGRREGRQEGRQEGVCTSIKNLMESTKVSAQQAMEMLQVSETDRDMYLAMLMAECQSLVY